MHITLVGMSNIGKTHWANRLIKESGFEKIDCDNLIEIRLGTILKNLGYSGIRDVAKWMGQPYAEQYSDTSEKFIACEQAVMLGIIGNLRDATPSDKPRVIDTTGSVIYARSDIVDSIRRLTRVVYLEASAAHEAELFKRYIAEPKPVVWGDNAFSRKDGESNEDALRRCYPALLASRAKRYRHMAHIVIPFERHKAADADLRILLDHK